MREELTPAITSSAAVTERQRRIKVLWLIKGLDPGGAERLLSMLAEVRDSQMFDYEVAYLLPWKRGLVPDLEAEGLTVHCLDGGEEWDLRWAWRLRHLILGRTFDVVHLHLPYVAGIARLIVRTIPDRARPRLVYTEHVPWWGYVRPSRYLNALTFGLDDAQIAVSAAVRDSIPKRNRRGVEVLLHGIFPDEVWARRSFRPAVREELGIQHDEVLIGTVAHFREQKDYPTLLRAARSLLDAGHRVRFLAVGHGPHEEAVRTVHRSLDLGEQFLFLGVQRDAPRILAACDVFVLSSLFEGLPLALMEALALGLPVVATAVGGVPEMITDGEEGILVPPARPDLLAHALARLVTHPDVRHAMGQKARRRAGDFDIRRAARRQEQLYLELARR